MFKGIDYYDIESELSPQARAVRDRARAFVEGNVMPHIGEHYRAGTFPLDLVPVMGGAGDVRGQPCRLRAARHRQPSLRPADEGTGAG